MRYIILFQAIFATAAQSAATSGCRKPLPGSIERGGARNTNSLEFVTSNGTVREYGLHIPTTYDDNTPSPLAFSFHGRTRTWQEQEEISGMSNETMNPNYLVVYPQGIDEQWQGDPEAVGYDDVDFTLELLANLSSVYCLDTNKIYAAGKSNGGAFAANVLACHSKASGVFAAFGGISGAYYQGDSENDCSPGTVPIPCNASRSPIPVFTTHGDADETIPYDGGPRRDRCLPNLPHFMTEWSERNGLGASNATSSLYHKNVVQYYYGNNKYPDVNAHYRVHGLGHYWPSLANGSSFDATPLLLNFWDKWTLDAVSTTPSATSSPSTTLPASATSSTSSASASSAGTIGQVSAQQWALGGLGVLSWLLFA
ncbi:alpha/beta-hydrolase [Aureobasidium namibiae CBS 147.97]|uniref:feruloyl esterase n=1 Tax=Aureobasidium namibiae CBS 147.97 TaxID=1043004 RepID=A0A074WFZ7_9PEZI|nr:alpha/beta-hydrolase [Aureobasidium namibiae CBS 147.97]KEQ70499.1 alpha/beta-hydrolase [Aureobasidium namibiae CBS 147.97]